MKEKKREKNVFSVSTKCNLLTWKMISYTVQRNYWNIVNWKI